MKKFWKNKKILVTGHTGFKGSWLSFILSEMGSKVHGLALKENKKSFFNIIDLKKYLETNNYCDIRDYKKLKRLVLHNKTVVNPNFSKKVIIPNASTFNRDLII